MLGDLLDHAFGTAPTKTLFHYTSYRGLEGIVASKTLRLTDARYLNDKLELKDFKLALNYEISRRHGELSKHPDARDYLKDTPEHRELRNLLSFQSWLNMSFGFDKAFGNDDWMVFIGSFTEEGNLLSQWRGYCPYGKGVSLGFYPDQIADCAKDRGLLIGRCLYTDQEKVAIASKVIDRVLELARKEPMIGYQPYDEGNLFSRFEPQLLTLASLVKHHAFAEEREWRVVRSACNSDAIDPLQFREGPSSLVPYIELKLPQHVSGKILLERIMLGPTPDEDLAFRSLRSFIKRETECHGIYRINSPYVER